MSRSRIAVPVFVLLAVLSATAQSNTQKSAGAAASSFDKVKSLDGSWEGKNPMGDPIQVSFRLTAGGSAVISELQSQMRGHQEDMITMFNMDGDRLLLTHYCEAGNQPRMTATTSPDGKTITFDFVGATNLASPDDGHMRQVVFTFVDANHHTEEWRFIDHSKEIVERFDLQKKS